MALVLPERYVLRNFPPSDALGQRPDWRRVKGNLLQYASTKLACERYRSQPSENEHVMPAVEEIILEIDEYVLQLRVGCKIIASAVLEERALVKLSHMGRSYARRHGMRFLDVARN